jgi:hypothetical protein
MQSTMPSPPAFFFFFLDVQLLTLSSACFPMVASPEWPCVPLLPFLYSSDSKLIFSLSSTLFSRLISTCKVGTTTSASSSAPLTSLSLTSDAFRRVIAVFTVGFALSNIPQNLLLLVVPPRWLFPINGGASRRFYTRDRECELTMWNEQ